MSQQGHWKASALAATFSSAGLNGTAWGAARPPLYRSTELGFGQSMHADPDTTPRRQKRKASSEDESMDSSSPTPEPAPRRVRSARDDDPVAAVINSSPAARRAVARKRTRTAEAAGPSEVALDKLLEPLEEKDLRQLLSALVAQNPQLSAQVRQLVPRPTVNSACSQLVRLEQRLAAAFPYNKAGPAADDYTFHRVRPALEELRDTIVMYLDHFTHHGLAGDLHTANALAHPAEWFDLLAQASDVAVRMPRWDKPENNRIRRDTLRQLADGWLRATTATARWADDGHIAGRDMLSRWAHQLGRFYAAEPDLFEPAVQVFQRSFSHLYPSLPVPPPPAASA
ncbi:Tethering factor for nuclear proteasome sts1 [Coemansia sp. RSA 2336]|nr:Tethering factor for nuclear proteasome sts1 [Coemansia sp. RSA 2336]